jgi:hypothetical protein
MNNDFLLGKTILRNSGGAIDPTSIGFKVVIDTLTYLRSKVIEQRFYEVPPADFMPVEVGEAAFADQIVQNLTFTLDGGFFQGDVNNANAAGKIANVDTALEPIRMPTQFWAKQTNWTVFELEQAARMMRWDIVESKLKALKKVWDLGVQETAFLGHPLVTSITGLLNNTNITPNTTFITTPIKNMSSTQFGAFISGVLSLYWSNCNYTQTPDIFVMPYSDYAGLGTPVSSTFPNISMLDYMTKTFQEMTRNPNFKIMPNAYCEATNNTSRGINKQRYALYKNDPETLALSIPVNLTMLPADTSNQLQWSQGAYGQYSGVLVNKPLEVMYFDASPST